MIIIPLIIPYYKLFDLDIVNSYISYLLIRLRIMKYSYSDNLLLIFKSQKIDRISGNTLFIVF